MEMGNLHSVPIMHLYFACFCNLNHCLNPGYLKVVLITFGGGRFVVGGFLK